MKKAAALILSTLVFFALCFAGCDPMNSNVTYENIYSNEQTLYDEVTDGIYKASYGYTQMMQQGYNGFYYKSLVNGSASDMSISNGVWKGKVATIDQGIMTSTSSESASRYFVSPVSGKAHVYGNPKLVSGSSARVVITLDGSIIEEYIIADSVGIYHSHSLEVSANSIIGFTVYGDAKIYWNPTVDFSGAGEQELHYAVDGYFGDVHPFWYDGKMYMYYLSTGKEQNSAHETFSTLLATSDNMINYQSTPIKMNPSSPPEQDLYYVLGVYKDADGLFRSSVGYNGCAVTSVSSDLLEWSSGSTPYIDDNDGFLKYTHRAYFDSDVTSGRDPYVWYDETTSTYYCIVINYYSSKGANGEKGLALYTAGKDGKYSSTAIKAINFTGRGDPECPQIIKIGNRWYIFYSVYGTGTSGNVGKFAYRMGDENVLPQNVNWNEAEEFYLDGGDLHAAQLCTVEDKLYMYGWLNYIPHTNVWGGYLNLPREVYQTEDGRLLSRCDDYLTDLLNMGKIVDFTSENTSCDGVSSTDGVFKSSLSGSVELSGEYGRSMLFANVSLPLSATSAGFTVKQGSSVYNVSLLRNGGNLYLTINNGAGVQLDSTYIKIQNANQTEFSVKVVLDGRFIEAFVNNEYSVSSITHFNNSENYNLSLSFNGANSTITNAQVCKLADYNNIFD